MISVCQQLYPHKAQALSQQLGLPLLDVLPTAKQWQTPQWQEQWVLAWFHEKHQDENEPAQLGLFSAHSGPVFIDFIGGKKQHRRQFGGGKGQPVARAIGFGSLFQGDESPRVIDATAGMGGDAFVFATLGCEVLMIERSPIVAALLQDALERAQQVSQSADCDPELRAIIARLHLVNADGADYLLQQQPQADVIYLDPMYPEKKKSASVKKEMKALQQLLGPDMDSSRLLAAALQTAMQRVVVKRPAKAPTLEHPALIQPNAQVESPNTRYDLYSIKALKAAGKL
jgi:16S rRNA (guanine1516-N2)-methyltransferase